MICGLQVLYVAYQSGVFVGSIRKEKNQCSGFGIRIRIQELTKRSKMLNNDIIMTYFYFLVNFTTLYLLIDFFC